MADFSAYQRSRFVAFLNYLFLKFRAIALPHSMPKLDHFASQFLDHFKSDLYHESDHLAYGGHFLSASRCFLPQCRRHTETPHIVELSPFHTPYIFWYNSGFGCEGPGINSQSSPLNRPCIGFNSDRACFAS
eukprot:880021-Amphidinium_carterae.1